MSRRDDPVTGLDAGDEERAAGSRPASSETDSLYDPTRPWLEQTGELATVGPLGTEIESGRRPGRFRRWVVRPLGWGLASFAVAAFLLQLWLDSPRGKEWVRARVESEIGALLDQEVSIDRVDFTLLPTTLELWDLRVGAPLESGADTFLLVPRTLVEMDPWPLRRRRARLALLRLERPEIRLAWFAQGGDNMPRLDPSLVPGGDARSAEPWEVWIDRVEIDRARFFLDDDRSELSLVADAVRTRLRGVGPLHLEGQMAAQGVEVRLPGAAPIEVAVALDATIERGLLAVPSARISRRGFSSQVTGRCDLVPESWDDRKCVFRTVGSARGDVLAELGYFRDLDGTFTFDGESAWRPGAFGWRGSVAADRLELWRRTIEDVRGVLAADRFGVRLDLEQARYAGGVLEGDVEADARAEGRPLSIALRLGDLWLDTLLADERIPVSGLASRVGGRFRYRCPLLDCERGDGRGEFELTGVSDDTGLALDGAFPLRIERGVVRADAISLRGARQSALGDGWFDVAAERGSWRYEIATADVGELLPLLPKSSDGTAPSWLPTAGAGRLTGVLALEPRSSSAERPGVSTDLVLRLEDVVTPRLATSRAVGSLTIDERGLHDLRLDLGDTERALHVEGYVPFDAGPGVALEDGTVDDATLRLAFDAYRWPMAQIQPWLETRLPLDGDVTGRLDLVIPPARADEGTQEEPASSGSLTASLAPARLDLGAASGPVPGVDLDALATRLEWDGARIVVHSLDARAPAGVVSGAGSVERATFDPVTGARVEGDIDLRLAAASLDLAAAPLASFTPRTGITGDVSMNAHIGGTWSAPSVELHAAGRELAVAGRPLPQGSRLDVVWDGEELGGAARLAEALVLEGGGRLDRESADLSFTLAAADLTELFELASDAPLTDAVGGSLRGEVLVHGPVAGPPEVLVRLDPVELRVAGSGRTLRNRSQIELSFRDGACVLRDIEMVEDATDTAVRLEGTILGVDAARFEPSLDLRVDASLDAAWVRLLVLESLPLEGRIDVDGRLLGALHDPWLEGRARLDGGRLRFDGFPEDLTDLEGSIVAAGDVLDLEGVRGRFAGGVVTVAGRIDLAGDVGSPAGDVEGGGPSFRFALDAAGVDLRHPDGWSLAGDADLLLRSTDDGALLSGRADLARLGWRQDLRFDLGEMVRQLLRRQRLEVVPADSTLSDVALNVQLVAPGTVVVDNNLAQLGGSADLFLRGDLATPVLYGEIIADRGGSLVYNGVDYTVERGRIVFVDPFELEAELDVLATTRVRDFDVTLAAFGGLDRLETRFSSEPPLPDVELFRLLAGGDVGGTEADLLDPRAARLRDEESTSAASFLYGQAASAIGDRVGTLFGLDKFRIDPLTGSDRDNLSKARVTVGKRLSKDVFVTYSVDPSSNENQRLQVEWRVSDSLTLVLTQNGDNTYSADARWDTVF